MSIPADAETVVWITGATGGLGAALAASVPFAGAHVVNLSRRENPATDNVFLDLTDPASWAAVEAYLAGALAAFRGRRAILVHNAVTGAAPQFVGEGERADAVRHALADAAGSMVLGDAFVRHCGPGYESGLVMLSSGTSAHPTAGRAIYGGAKAGIEQWVRVVRAERARRGSGPWVVAVRPGAVDTPLLRAQAGADPHSYPIAEDIKKSFAEGVPVAPEVVARRIWDLLPPAPEADPVLVVGRPVASAHYGAANG